MNYLKRVVATVAVLVLIFSLAACSTAAVQTTAMPTVAATATPVATETIPADTSAMPSPTEAVATPSPEPGDTAVVDDNGDDGDVDSDGVPTFDIPDLKTVGLTNEQYSKIDQLLFGALSIKHFTNPKSLRRIDLLTFADTVLRDDPGSLIGDNWDAEEDSNCNNLISKGNVEKIIDSAFNLDFHSVNFTDDNCPLPYNDNKYLFSPGCTEGYDFAQVYSITRTSQNQLCLLMNLDNVGGDDNYYDGKVKVIIQEDANSVFGYHLVSLTKIKETRLKYSSITASSFVAPAGGKTFVPKNAADKKDSTVWKTEKGVGEWILFRFDEPQNITGVGFEYDDDNDTFSPESVKVEFSDGTVISDVCGWRSYTGLSHIVKTEYVKIIIQSLNDDTSNTVVIPEVVIN